LGIALSGCAVNSARHPLVGRGKLDRAQAAYWVHLDGDWLQIRMTAGEHARRFQGSITSVDGTPLPLQLERPAQAQQIAAQGPSVQFDVDMARGAEDGFRIRADRHCLRFDLYVDGAHHAGRIHLGKKRLSPQQVPFERCP
jgi:hypothetical protein